MGISAFKVEGKMPEKAGERKGRVKSRNMYIKDPWTKQRGRLKVGGWWAGQGRAIGEKWGNCN